MVTNALIRFEIAIVVALVFNNNININKNIKIKLCSEGTVVSYLVDVISCNAMYLSQVMNSSRFYRPPNENIRDFIEFLNNKIFLFILKILNSILCGDINVNLYNPLYLTSIEKCVNSLSGQGYFLLILKPIRLAPENPVTKYSLFDQMW